MSHNATEAQSGPSRPATYTLVAGLLARVPSSYRACRQTMNAVMPNRQLATNTAPTTFQKKTASMRTLNPISRKDT